MANFDLTNLAIQALCPSNEILYDDKNRPSIMVKIPKMTYAELGMGDSTATFPAFIVNGQEVDAIWISKYQNVVQDSRAYSLPGKDPKASINFDAALAACTAKGAGWHLMTAMEWGLMLRICAKAGITPLGNNNYGKHNSETAYKAIPMTKDGTGKTLHVATGTGPLSWSHDQTVAGIWDLCGNVWEWTGGIRSVYGELQILTNNNAADNSHAQTAASDQWMAIKAADGTLITPNGSGTTTGSVKMDWASSKLTYSTSISDASPGEHSCAFSAITCDGTISDAAKNLLIAIGMLPGSATAEFTQSQTCYFNNAQEERCFNRGGSCYGTNGGFPSFSGSNARSNANANIGFRSAYVVLPSAS
ncbi:MAG: SUMF1/EgtB/PvdO family nonheme iron enzyme [Firmicutes bacterium]|nr:SUMF1/EgtB/PvdO family nonheme iron enzyme [Bacillota bacterium]